MSNPMIQQARAVPPRSGKVLTGAEAPGVGEERMSEFTAEGEASRQQESDRFPPEGLPEEFWSLIPLEELQEAEPGDLEEPGRRYLVLSRGHADLFPILQRLLAGLEGIEIVVDRRSSSPPPEVAAHRAEPVLASPPGPAVVPADDAVEVPEIEVKTEEEAPPPLVQRYIIVSRTHADLAEILRRFQVAYHGVEIYVLVDRRDLPERRGASRGERRSRPQITSTPPQPRLGVPPKTP